MTAQSSGLENRLVWPSCAFQVPVDLMRFASPGSMIGMKVQLSAQLQLSIDSADILISNLVESSG